MIARRLRPMWIWAALLAAWRNRADLARWWSFARTAVNERGVRPPAEMLTEARVRAAVTADRALRHDPTLRDLRVDNGVVTLSTTAGFPRHDDPFARLKKVKGITDVRTRAAAVQTVPTRPDSTPPVAAPFAIPGDVASGG